MATPTPSTNTPQKNLAALSSPAPRSVPPINFDSPAVLNMLVEGGVGMGISMSGMGLSQMAFSNSQLGPMVRADEDERRRRLQSILGALNERPRRVSEEGIIALCNKEGVECEHMVEADGTVQLTLVIGNEAICDVWMVNGDVKRVKLEIASDTEFVFRESGSHILYKTLTTCPGVNKINLTLDKFGQNLDKLLRMDKLSAENGGVPCYKAVFRIYESLKRLFDHEKKMALAVMEAGTPDAEYKAEREVLCKKSGRPRMNAGQCLGLSLEYWMDRRHIISKKPVLPTSVKGKEKMDIDPPLANAYPEDADPDTHKIYSLTIECEASPSSMYTPIRIPTSWISDSIEKVPGAADTDIGNLLLNTSQIDWLDPKPTFLDSPANTNPDAMNLDDAPGRLPNVRFVAKFNPPLVVPIQEYVNLLRQVGLDWNQQDLRQTTFAGLAIRPQEPDPMIASANGATVEIRSEKKTLARDADGHEMLRTHANTLLVPRLEYSRALDSLPFQHPKQLVEMLPTLRTYAFTTSLVQNTFGTRAAPPSAPLPRTSSDPAPKPLPLDLTLSYTSPAPNLTLHIPHPLSASGPSPQPQSPTPDTIAYLLASASTSPSSSSSLHPPLKIDFRIASNAEIAILEQNVVQTDPATAVAAAGSGGPDAQDALERLAREGEAQKRVARALDVCGDLGVWAEWLGREAGKR